MYPASSNVINYDAPKLQFHNVLQYKDGKAERTIIAFHFEKAICYLACLSGRIDLRLSCDRATLTLALFGL